MSTMAAPPNYSYMPPAVAQMAPPVMMQRPAGPQGGSFVPPEVAGAGMTHPAYTAFATASAVSAPQRVASHFPPNMQPGSHVRLRGASEGSPFAGSVLVVMSDPPDRMGQLKVEPAEGGNMSLLVTPAMLEPADRAPQQQAPQAPAPVAAWLEGGGGDIANNGLRAGDQVRLKGRAGNNQYDGKAMIVEAPDVGDGSGRCRVVVHHETHVSRLALDPAFLEVVAQGNTFAMP